MKKRMIKGIVALMVGAALVGCGSKDTANENKISVVGSTTVAEPMEKLAAKYKEIGNTDTVEVQGIGSSAGVKAVLDGTAAIGMVSRELKEEEKKEGIVETVIAYDGIAMVVHPTNTVTNLTKEQLKDIYEGKITNWKEVGGVDQDIIVVTREAGSGTRGAFEEILHLLDGDKASTIIESALVAEGTGTVMATVASKEAAIGFISLGYMDETVKPVSIDQVVPTPQAVKEGSYTISRPLLVITKQEVSESAQKFMDFIVDTEAQKIIAEKYIPVKSE